MSQDLLSSVAGIVLSLLFSYVPGVSAWFEALDSIYKRIIMGVLIILVGGGAYAAACLGVYDAVTCDQEGGLSVLRSIVAVLIANQAAYKLTKG